MSYYRYETIRKVQDIEPAELLSPSTDATIQPDAQFRWSTPCDCLYTLVIRTESGDVLLESEETANAGYDAYALPSGEHVIATLYTRVEDRIYARNSAFVVAESR